MELIIACKQGNLEKVQSLLDNGVDVQSCSFQGATGLHTACQNGHIEVIKLLIKYNTDINAKTHQGI
jgi:ankyrin repeat protein